MDTYRQRAIARTFERTRDPQCAPDPSEPDTVSGSEAKRGDTVIHVHTGEVATVVAGSQFGRIAVGTKPGNGAFAKWERTSVRVIV